MSFLSISKLSYIIKFLSLKVLDFSQVQTNRQNLYLSAGWKRMPCTLSMMCKKVIGKIEVFSKMYLLFKLRTSLGMEEMFFTVNFIGF